MSDPLFDLSGKTALVTGGSRGLGYQMVKAFAERGADVIIASRKLEACEEVAEMDKNREEADKNIDSIRPERDRLLTMTDWTVGNDSPLSTSKQDEYKVYRTKLRDLPAAYSKVSEVVWPTPPS